MPQRTYRIHGIIADDKSQLDVAQLPKSDRIFDHKARLIPGRARDGVTSELEVASDEVVRVELENGFVLWSRADDLVREYGTNIQTRDGTSHFEFRSLVKERGMPLSRDERGLLGLGIKVLDFFGIHLAEKAAGKLCEKYEDKLLDGRKSGLYRCTLDDDFSLKALAEDETIPTDQGKLLVFIHGTASSGKGGFGKLSAPDNSEGKTLRIRLKQEYGDRVFAFEHRSLTESPVTNALALVKSLPSGAEVHLVSHSRGGMVGELICLGECETFKKTLSPEELDALLNPLFKADNEMLADQLGLSPLDTSEWNERENAYAADLSNLTNLIKELNQKKLRISRFVRVACPARGTTLASGRLDRWLSMLDYLGDLTGDGLLADGMNFLLSVVKERTDPRTLPGLEAMMPGSPVTRLLNDSSLVTQADLTVISGDIEGDSTWQKLKLVALDWFYGADHDLVVNTGSMVGGLRRPPGGARFRKAKGPDVNHFRYFENRESIGWLDNGLSRPDGEDGGFLPIDAAQKEAPRWRDAVARSRAATSPRPLAVLLPGTMGSSLTVNDDRIWLNYARLAFGGLKRIEFKEPDNKIVKPENLLDDFYGPLLEFLARTHRVEIFPYDWRHSVRDAANKLMDKLEELLPRAEKEQQPVHLVAHSMGGLVVRTLIADEKRGAALWQRIIRLPNSRFLMLGTPNLGSYEAFRWLTGFNPTQAKLALLDLTQNTNEIINLVRNFPGLLELLPFGPNDEDFTDPKRWQTIKNAMGANWETAESTKLDKLSLTWNGLRNHSPDPRYTCYVAGCQPATVIGYQFTDYDKPSSTRKRLEFIATRQGDGTVPWSSGKLDGIDLWYVEDTAHDALCAKKKAFTAYLDLLMTGRTTRLQTTPPLRNRSADGVRDMFILPSAPPVDGVPGEDEFSRLGFSGSLPPVQVGDDRPAVPTIKVCIRHGDLSYSRHPILVGHYLGDTIVSAEKALDKQLNGALTKRLDLGIYPGPLDTHALFFNEKPAGKPSGAIVMGLGQVGELTPGLLEAGIRHALLDYALQVMQWPDDRFGKTGAPRKGSISCLLIGSGAGGMTVRDSIEAILRGAVATNTRLVNAQMDDRVTVDEIEFIELFEDVAISAVEGLRQVLTDGELATVVNWPTGSIEPGQAGCRRVRFEEAPEWWHRLEILEEEDRDQLRFIATTERARAEETLATGQLALAESFIRQASSSATANPEAARTLFEMLLPLRLKELAPRQTDLVLLVDERSARYPWELLENRWSDNGRPPAITAGLVRQLKTPEFRPHPAHATGNKALVVGNPDLSAWEKFSDLPGARHEAGKVASLLNETRYEVSDCIDEKSDVIIENLHRNAWRILHLAGHGVFDFPLENVRTATGHGYQHNPSSPQKTISGMVIGKNTILTPGDIEQMRWVPELVFINCCHLGRAGDRNSLDRGALAANLGLHFIRMGARAVVAAGWAVDDGAALAFAETFYKWMLAGETFGKAVRAAREDIWLRFPGVNTWGAYQCYGDPSYQLHRDGSRSVRKPQPYAAPSELVADLENLINSLKAGSGQTPETDNEPKQKISALLDRIPATQRDTWLGRADVCAALGLAWGEARNWLSAIEWLDKSRKAGKGDCPLRALEQLANFQVREAAERWETRRQSATKTKSSDDNEVAIIQSAIERLQTLVEFGKTEERLNLLGGSYKRLALVHPDKEGRKTALQQMATYYYDAFKCSNKAYPFTNWATAGLLGGIPDPKDPKKMSPDDFRATIKREIVRVTEYLTQSNEDNPNFWDSAALADLDLIRLLLECGLPYPLTASHKNVQGGKKTEKRQTIVEKLPEQTRNYTDRIIEAYRNAIQRGASPREVASVRENIDFIIAMLDLPTTTESKALRLIRDAL